MLDLSEGKLDSFVSDALRSWTVICREWRKSGFRACREFGGHSMTVTCAERNCYSRSGVRGTWGRNNGRECRKMKHICGSMNSLNAAIESSAILKKPRQDEYVFFNRIQTSLNHQMH